LQEQIKKTAATSAAVNVFTVNDEED
jgi:hypothetical protein